ncbi:MAG TPA: TonB-dependent receptor [Bacteroidetes bacterium]|nr:TonB-dependent receptor [Bacteroidota bacterium]
MVLILLLAICNINAAQPILSWLSFRVEVRNILDADYEEEYGYPGPDRQFFTGLNLNW